MRRDRTPGEANMLPYLVKIVLPIFIVILITAHRVHLVSGSRTADGRRRMLGDGPSRSVR